MGGFNFSCGAIVEPASAPSTISAGRPKKLVVFGSDAAEAAQIRRMRSYLDCGFDVTGFMMRRANMNPDFVPFWDNVHLCYTGNESIGGRMAAIARSIVKVSAHRLTLASADVIVARNLDMLSIAAAVRRLVAPRPPLIYECLDIHSLMTDRGVKGRVARVAERGLLSQTSSLMVSSPAFVREYFEPVQGWRGPVALVENKLRISSGGAARPDPRAIAVPESWSAERPMVLGWVGTLRCAQSLALLAVVAERMGPKLKIAMHGAVHHHAIPEFDEVVAAHPNISWYGPYDYPQGLEAIYRDCDLVWSQDLWQWGTNSNWLLPNRIYEASYFGCPSIAVDGSETGRRVRNNLGWTIPTAEPAELVAQLERLSPADLVAQRRAILKRPEAEFRQSAEEIAAAVRMPFDGGDHPTKVVADAVR